MRIKESHQKLFIMLMEVVKECKEGQLSEELGEQRIKAMFRLGLFSKVITESEANELITFSKTKEAMSLYMKLKK